MDFQIKIENGHAIVSLRGRLDLTTAPECEQKFREVIADRLGMVVDMGGVEYISSAGLKTLFLLARMMKDKSGRICLANANDNVRTVIDISGLNRILEIKDSIDEAIAAIS